MKPRVVTVTGTKLLQKQPPCLPEFVLTETFPKEEKSWLQKVFEKLGL